MSANIGPTGDLSDTETQSLSALETSSIEFNPIPLGNSTCAETGNNNLKPNYANDISDIHIIKRKFVVVVITFTLLEFWNRPYITTKEQNIILPNFNGQFNMNIYFKRTYLFQMFHSW